MLRAFLRGRVTAFEKTWGYDASYMHELIAVSPSVAMRFGLVSSLGHLAGAPAEALAAASLVGTLSEDCGPCTQLGVDLALKRAVQPHVLRVILAGDPGAMGGAAGLAFRFAQASLARDLRATDALRDEVVERWGKRGLVAISLALTTARMYPTLKYALGYGRACSRIEVEGAQASLPQRALSP
jgi:hypothetical protein